MATIYYQVEGKTYSYELDETKVLESIDKNFDFNISLPSGFGDGFFNGFDIRYQNTVNAVSYISNISKAKTKEDFERWFSLYRETIYNQLVYENNILTKEVERFKSDYGTVTDLISNKINEVVKVANDTKSLIELFVSMSSIVAVITELVAVLVPLGVIVGVIVGLDNLVKSVEIGKREQNILTQVEKVKSLLESLNDTSFYNQLNTFEEKVPKSLLSSTNQDFLTKYKYLIIALIIFAIWYWYKNKN